ncbi:ATP-binding protein [Maribacter sp. 2307ULW6-5]|uniref:ATP-binding protein n=1 Tax=Maribacter sp. 2307ULW6-5 TaxID=3386275 RepID=UPI0039BC349D
MPSTKSKDLLDQLLELEQAMDTFSYEELNAEEATSLKNSFQRFKSRLENKILAPGNPLPKEASLAGETGLKADPGLFMAQISHEIRTPLNGIIGFANLLMEEQLTSTQSSRVYAIRSASYAMLDIINEVLDYNRLASGKEPLNRVDFELNAVVQDVIFLCKTLLMEREVALNVKIEEDVPKHLMGDPAKLTQVLLNLYGNAMKFVEKGHIDLSVAVSAKRQGQYHLRFTLEDTGIGISPKALETIFHRYTQASPGSKKYGGSGLGLSIVKKIIELQNGTISATSTKGKGTTFTFCIPYEAGKPSAQHRPFDPTEEVKSDADELAGTQILVFEDNELNQKLISEQLERWRCRVYVTDDPDTGFAHYQNYPIDVVLMDLKMPKMNGFEVARRIRGLRNSQGQAAPILALSADFTAKDQRRFTDSGIDDFLLKPYASKDLREKLKNNIGAGGLSKSSRDLLQTKMVCAERPKFINLSALWEECSGNVGVLAELVRLLKQNCYEFLGAVKTNLNMGNYADIAAAAHKVKAGLDMAGAAALREHAQAMEQFAKIGAKQKISEEYTAFLELYPIVEAQMDKALENIKNEDNGS